MQRSRKLFWWLSGILALSCADEKGNTTSAADTTSAAGTMTESDTVEATSAVTGSASDSGPVEGCHSDEECPPNEGCSGPGNPSCGAGCGGTDTCQTDAECGDLVCGQAFDGCCPGPYRLCVTRCTGPGTCAADEVCDANGHCLVESCADGYACPVLWTCEPGAGTRHECVRATCDSDAACPGGACVNGRCYEGPGVCMGPSP